MQSAAVGGHLEVVKLLLMSGMAVDEKDKEGLTPLMNACEHGSVDVVQALHEAGGDLNTGKWRV